MGAGLDFPGALRFYVNESGDKGEPLVEELKRILDELELGHTRSQALKGFAARVSADSVRDFVNAVVQAEEKGNPLADVLAIQAEMLRMRRSVAAEEAAARAGVMMMLPLMILMADVLMILFGPFVITGAGF